MRLSIRQLRQVELEQLTAIVADDDAGDLRPRERAQYLVGGRHADDDGRPRRVCLAEALDVVDRFHDQRLVERHVRIALDRDLRNAGAARPPPALPHSSMRAPGSASTISTPFARSRSACGVPVRSPNVPQWIGMQRFEPRSSSATAASSGPIVKWSPIGRIATSGEYSRPISCMSEKTAVSPAQ